MLTSPLSKTYDPGAVESHLYEFWLQHRLFKPETCRLETYQENLSSNSLEYFSIVIPPPNVTGTLHMGHALDCTIQDILVRWRRMQGVKTLWMPGMDHAGIATQNVVERMLRESGQTKHDLGREEFLKVVWSWADARKQDILRQFQRLGISPDWDRLRFTLDEGCSKAVREAFVTLYERGLIYRGMYTVNWCPRCTSAISDIETDYADEEGSLWEIAYPLSDGSNSLVVATTRPETMFGDVAIAVNPQDARYAAYIGKTVLLPLTAREIPIIADDYVDMNFGTGVLKITPAHDPNDFKIGQAHGLTPLWALDETGHLRHEAFIPESLRGLNRSEARTRTVDLLKMQGSLVRVLEHNHRVGHCQRCQTTIEPYLSMQWFVRTKPLADKAIASLADGGLKFVPERWSREYLRWMNNIQDWCISRQLWWGHQVPAWYCDDCGEMFVLREAPVQCPHCRSGNLHQDSDVLDTWFSSGLWPFSTMGWPWESEDPDMSGDRQFYPTKVLVTGFDIIFFWVARMVMMGLELTGSSPFETVYIHGLIRDEKGQKMSKSKGNTVDPVEAINEYGCDGFRFALTSLITYGGQDIKLSKDKIEIGKLFANKLWNAARFVLMNTGGVAEAPSAIPIDENLLSVMDLWILSRFHTVAHMANELLHEYKFGELAAALYDFTWNAFCDWYVEYAKKQLADPHLAINTQIILLEILEGILALLHPIMPYITEEIWQQLPHRPGISIMISSYPTGESRWISPEINRKTDFLLEVVRAIRNIRQQYMIPHQAEVQVVLEAPELGEREAVQEGREILNHFVKISELTISEKLNGKPSHAAANVVGHSRVLIPLEGIIDVSQELGRLRKKREVLLKEQDQLYKMISNFEFLERAPVDVVEKNKSRIQEVNKQVKVLEEQIESLA